MDAYTGPGNRLLHVHLSAARDDQPSPLEALGTLAGAVAAEVDADIKEPAESFLRTALAECLLEGHGTLIAVLPANADPPDVLVEDAVRLAEQVDIADAVRGHERDQSSSALATLIATKNLLAGVLSSDGITLLSADAKLIGYRAFVRSPPPEPGTPPSELVGGARRRAYQVLSGLVDAGRLRAAFFRSSDGRSEIKEFEHGG